MPVPSSLADLSTTAASNSPAGSDSIGTSLDDYLRSIQSIIKQGVSKGSDIASASTITPVATSSYFVVTGTTSITAIGETYSWTGRVVVLKFDNTLTLTHSSGLILPGAANISTAAGDVASFVNESTGVWRCVHYQKASGGEVATSATETFTNKTLLASGSNTVEATSGPGSSAFAFRNKIIGGDFTTNPWQRGTSFALNTSGVYTADRWTGFQLGSAASTVSRQNASLEGFRYCLRLARDSGSALTGQINLYQALETSNSFPLQNKAVTLSFYARKGANFSATSDILLSSILSGTGTDEGAVATWTGSATVATQNNTLTTSWQRFTVTGTVGASATQLRVSFAFTPTGTAGAADYVEIAGVQLEAGSVATPFETRPYGVELALCQRYYQRLSAAGTNNAYFAGSWQNATTINTPIVPRVPLRTAPSVFIASNILQVAGGTGWVTTAYGIDVNPTGDSFRVNWTASTGAATAGNGGFVQSSGASSYIEMGAEL